MDGLEHRGKLPFGIEICGRSDPDRADDRGAQVGKNVAEKIRADDNVEPVGMAHKMSCQNVDVVLVRADVRKFTAHGAEAFVPEWHRVDDAV